MAVRCIVQKSRPSSNVKVRGQGHQGQKRKNAESLQLTMHAKAMRVLQTIHCTQQQTSPLCGRQGVTAAHVDGGLHAVLSGAVLGGTDTLVGKSAHAVWFGYLSRIGCK